MKFNPEWLIGKTIAHVSMTRAAVQRSQDEPCIVFTDGSSIALSVEQTSKKYEDYGIAVLYSGGHGKPKPVANVTGPRPLAKLIAKRTADAFSVKRYRSWPAVAEAFLAAGYGEKETEALMRSKWMRWAADDVGQDSKVEATVAANYCKKNLDGHSLKQLVLNTFGTEEKT